MALTGPPSIHKLIEEALDHCDAERPDATNSIKAAYAANAVEQHILAKMADRNRKALDALITGDMPVTQRDLEHAIESALGD